MRRLLFARACAIFRRLCERSAKDYPDKLRRIRFYDKEKKRHLEFLTNNHSLPAEVVAQLFKCRWQIELFFKWIKQHLRIKAFHGTSENGVKTQIWIAISVYVLVVIIKKRMQLALSTYTNLQILSVTLLEKTPILRVFSEQFDILDKEHDPDQLNLFDL